MAIGLLLGLCALPLTVWAQLRVDSVRFFYKPDAEVRFLDLKTAWQSRFPARAFRLEDAAEVAQEAHQAATLEEPFTNPPDLWLQHGGVHPSIVTPKIHLVNPSPSKARLNIPLKVVVRGKFGELRVHPQVLLTDYAHLSRTARWRVLSEKTVTIPVLAPGERQWVSLEPIHLYKLLKAAPGQWPETLAVTVQTPGSKKPAVGSLYLVPDHFVLPPEEGF